MKKSVLVKMKRIISSLVETNSAEDYFQHQLNEKAIPKTWQLFCGCKKTSLQSTLLKNYSEFLTISFVGFGMFQVDFKIILNWLNLTMHAKLLSLLTGTGRFSRSRTTIYQH